MNKSIKNIIILAILFLTFSCITGSSKDRGSLSDAMDAARDDSDDRTIPDFKDDGGWESDDEFWGNNPPIEDDYDEAVGTSFEPNPEAIIVLRSGPSITSSSYFDSLINIEVLIGAGDGNLEVYFYGGFKSLEVKESSSIYETIKEDATMLTGGIESKYYPFKYLKIFSPYLIGRVGGMYFFWDYLNSFYSGGDYIDSDILGGVSGAVGLGLDLIRLDTFNLGIQCVPTGYLFSGETTQGFTNDYFSEYGEVTLSVEAGYKF
ncbi:MAG: hypothetical protein OCD02_06080 [Spirochaetaceae bacterium]